MSSGVNTNYNNPATSNMDFAFDRGEAEEVINDQPETSSTDSSPENSPTKLPPPKVSPIKIPEVRLVNPKTFNQVMNPKKNPDVRRLVTQGAFIESKQSELDLLAQDKRYKSNDALNESMETYNEGVARQLQSNSNMYLQQSNYYTGASNTAAQAAAVFKSRMQYGLENIPTTRSSQQQ